MIDTKALAETLKPRFGADVSITLARAPAWGNDDACLLINGTRHEETTLAVIVGLAAVGATKFKTEVLGSYGFRGIPPYTYSLLSFQP